MINFVKSTFYNENDTKKKLIKFIATADKLSFGEECEKFESNFAKYQKRKYCIFVNSGSSANLALIQALLNLGKLKKGDRVGFSTLRRVLKNEATGYNFYSHFNYSLNVRGSRSG